MRGKAPVYACALTAILLAALTLPALCGPSLKHRLGLWLDERISAAISSFIGYPVRLIDVRPQAPDQATFSLATIEERMGKTLLAAGNGLILLDDWRTLLDGRDSGGRIILSDVAILEDLYRGAPIFAWASKDAFTDPIFAEKVRLSWRRSGDSTLLRILSFESRELLLHGGLLWVEGRGVIKAHAVLFAPDDRFERFPKELRARMIRRGDGWSGVRLTFSEGSLVVEGRHGPFFKALWA